MAEPTTTGRQGELAYGVFKLLAEAPEGLPVGEVMNQLRHLVPPTDEEELGYPSYPNRPRYNVLVQFATLATVKAGWLIKSDAIWRLTEAGQTALEDYQDSASFFATAVKAYNSWRKATAMSAELQQPHDLAPGERSWVFQANPDMYDIASALESMSKQTWLAKQSAGEMQVDDTVFLWQSGESGGFLAVGRLATTPAMMAQLPGEEAFDVDPEPFDGERLRVVIEIEHLVSPPLTRAVVLADPTLKDLPHLKFTQGSNYKLTAAQGQAIAAALAGRLVEPGAGGPMEPDTPPADWRGDLFDAAVKAYRSTSWLDDAAHDLACAGLRDWLDARAGYSDEALWAGISTRLLPYGTAVIDGAQVAPGQTPIISPEDFAKLAAEGKVTVTGNWHWTGLGRRAGSAKAAMPKFRTALDKVLGGPEPDAKRLRWVMRPENRVSGWGQALWTGLLAMASGWKTPVVNTTVKVAFDKIGWPLEEWDTDIVVEQLASRSAFLLARSGLDTLAQLDRVYWFAATADSGVPTLKPGPASPKALTVGELEGSLYVAPGYLADVEWLLRDRKQVVFYGPPGTGKTFVAERFAAWFAGSPDRTKTIQFHASYAYEDFMEGIRPDLGSGELRYELKPGILREFADLARADAGHDYVLVIDEINRANLSRVFGELLFLLEYRKAEIELPYSREKFSLPDNLHLIGTMNTADRSIALVDFALRRRFHFVEFPADPEILRRWLLEKRPGMAEVADLLAWVNRTVADRDFAVGFSYFMKDDLDEVLLQRLWRHSVLPALHEFYFDESSKPSDFELATVRKAIAKPVPVTDEPELPENVIEALLGRAPQP